MKNQSARILESNKSRHRKMIEDVQKRKATREDWGNNLMRVTRALRFTREAGLVNPNLEKDGV